MQNLYLLLSDPALQFHAIPNQIPLVEINHKASSNYGRIEKWTAAWWSERKELDVAKH